MTNKIIGSNPFGREAKLINAISFFGTQNEAISCFQSAMDINVTRTGDGWKQIFDSLILTYHKLTKLGFTYYYGKVAIIENCCV